MNRYLLAGAVLAMTFGTALLADDKGLKDLEGTYKVNGLTKGGVEVPEEIRKGVSVKFKGDEMSLVLPDRTMAAKIKVDASKTPNTIEISPADGPEKGKTFPGIYKLEKGELIIAFAEKGNRPTEFKAEGETALMKLVKSDK